MEVKVRFHGRGGQGIVTASQILATALVREGYWILAFPEFGPERRGAPVKAYLKFSENKILLREPVLEPDVVVVSDTSLFSSDDVFIGISDKTVFVVNAKEDEIEKLKLSKVYFVDALDVALKTLGRPIVNTALVGAFCKALGVPKIEDVLDALEDFFDGVKLERNRKAVETAYENTKLFTL